MGCVYQAKNKITGKCYIGQTTKDLRSRIYNHYRASREFSNLSADLEDYGLDSFEWSILFQSNNKNELKQMEHEFIFLRNTLYPRGYNKNMRYFKQKKRYKL